MKTAEHILKEFFEQAKIKYPNENWKEFDEVEIEREFIVEAMESFAAQSVREDRKSRWISVKDRYPEIKDADFNGNILGWDKFQKEAHKCNWKDVCKMKLRFTHWQPLQSPPINQ